MNKPVENWEVLTTIKGNNIPNQVAMETKDQIEAITSLKTRVREELTKAGFPDLAFLYSSEVLKIVPELLLELLEENKVHFKSLLEKPIDSITFDDLNTPNPLKYLFGLLNHLDGVHKSEISEKIIEDFDPIYTAYLNEIWFSKPYYNIFIHVLQNTQVNAEEKRILELEIQEFEKNGINLDETAQNTVKEINIKLSKLSNDFSNNIVKDKKRFSYQILDFEVIKNLPEATIQNAKKKALQEGKNGYLFDADPTAYGDILKYCSDSKIREDFAKAKNSFASNGTFDNRPVVLKILQLQQQKAQILGYKNYAELSLDKKMAKTPKTVFDLLDGITQKAKQKAHNDVEELKSYFHVDHMEYWDALYYETLLKKEKYAFDDKELKKYFEYENVMKYLFDHVKSFYWVTMKKIESVSYDPNIEIYEVYKDGKLISYYILDPFYRETKSPWAWADNLRGRDIFNGVEKIPVIVNVCNFQKSPEWKTILPMRDVETLFHEFGHALSEILSESPYSDLSGFHVEWDFVELASQINENWVTDKESLVKLARHVETWEPLPTQMLETLEILKTYMSGTSVLTQNNYALLDMNLYSRTPPQTIEELDAICLELSNAYTVFPKWEEFKMYTSFGHIFGWWYAAGYYSYMRAEILEADVFAKIKELWMFDRNVWELFIKTILGQGTRKPAWELFQDFMGRELSNVAFMERKGLV